jgi:hypothetical protein
MRKPALIEIKLVISPPLEGKLTDELMDNALAAARLMTYGGDLRRAVEKEMQDFPALRGFEVEVAVLE